MKSIKIHPSVFFSLIAATVAIALYFGFTTALAPPPSIIGINRDGSFMTREQANKMADMMSGGRFSKKSAAAKTK